MATRYRKTTQGTDALAKRTKVLSPRERALLIMLDGRRSLEELSAGFAGADDLIRGLTAAGLAELVDDSTPNFASQGESARSPVVLANAQRLAVRRINDLLGPSGTALCIRVEASRSLADLRAAAKRAESVIREAAGANAADQFCKDIEATLHT